MNRFLAQLLDPLCPKLAKSLPDYFYLFIIIIYEFTWFHAPPDHELVARFEDVEGAVHEGHGGGGHEDGDGDPVSARQREGVQLRHGLPFPHFVGVGEMLRHEHINKIASDEPSGRQVLKTKMEALVA